jgi:hypothetical protein
MSNEWAGVPCRDYNKERHLIEFNKSRMRKFQKEDEKERKIKLSTIKKKDHHFYSSKDSLWNEFSKLSPKQ